MNKKTAGKYLAAVAILATALAGYSAFGWGHLGPVNSLKLDLAKPDALVLTQSLSTLPRDLLTVPLARDVLREDFLFYYEQSEDRLGLKGSLRRIAYEHELNWGDQLIRMVLDEPAEVALWRDADGSLKHYAIAVTRGKLMGLLEQAGRIALKDSQLRLAGKLAVDGEQVQVYALDYAYKRTLLFAAHGQRMVILSDPGMLYGGKDGTDGDRAAQHVVGSLLAADKASQEIFHPQFSIDRTAGKGHSIAIKADFLSFGYQPFFGALQALRFDFANGRWQSRMLIDAARLSRGGYDSAVLWDALPYDPAACFAVPVDWPSTQALFQRLGRADAGTPAPASTLASQLSGPAAACWYGKSRLHTPVFVATLGKPTAAAVSPAARDAQLAGLFAAITGGGGEIDRQAVAGGTRWQRKIDSAAGELAPAMAVAGNTVVFSADAALVDQVVAVHARRAPAAGDRMADGAHVVGLISPAALARLIQAETVDALPEKEEPVLRGAAEAQLMPRLNALKKYPPYRMVLKTLPAKGLAWQPLEWQAAAR